MTDDQFPKRMLSEKNLKGLMQVLTQEICRLEPRAPFTCLLLEQISTPIGLALSLRIGILTWDKRIERAQCSPTPLERLLVVGRAPMDYLEDEMRLLARKVAPELILKSRPPAPDSVRPGGASTL